MFIFKLKREIVKALSFENEWILMLTNYNQNWIYQWLYDYLIMLISLLALK